MSFKDFLDSNGVKEIPPILIEVMDTVIAPALILSWSIPPSPPVPAPLPALAVAAILARTQAPNAAGAAILFGQILTDISTMVYAPLTAGAAGLLKVPPLGVPGGPIAAAACGSLNPAFGRAVMQWVVSLLPPIDLRIIVPFIVP